MRALQTSARNHTTFRQRRLVCALLITLALLVPLRNPFAASATNAPVESTVVLDPAGAPFLQGTFQVVSNDQANETSLHVDCDIASYTYNELGTADIHYQNLSTGVDNVVPGNHLDILSDISGSRIAFVEVSNSGDFIRVFDTISHAQTVIPGFEKNLPSIGGNLVAFEDRSAAFGIPAIVTYDLNSGTITQLTNDSLSNVFPQVSPNGDAVVWNKCQFTGCDIYAAIQTSPGAFTTRALTTGKREEPFASATNGELAVYVSNRSGEKDIYYQPLTGGTEIHLSIPGDQRFPTISGDFITFESVVQTGADIFVYDIRTEKLYRVTNDQVDHHFADISVCNGVGRIVYRTESNGGLDAYAFTFQVPSVIEEQIDVVITEIGNFNLPPGTANSLVTKLQTALAAIEAGDAATACSSLTGFINECRAQSGKKLTPGQSTQLITSANQIKTDLGCP